MPQAAQGSGYTFQSFVLLSTTRKQQQKDLHCYPSCKKPEPIAIVGFNFRVVNFNKYFAIKLTTLLNLRLLIFFESSPI